MADALGNPLPSAKVTVKDVRNAKLKSVSSNTPLSKVDGTTYSGNLAGAKLERGLYTVTVAVEGSGIIAPASKTIKVREKKGAKARDEMVPCDHCVAGITVASGPPLVMV